MAGGPTPARSNRYCAPPTWWPTPHHRSAWRRAPFRTDLVLPVTPGDSMPSDDQQIRKRLQSLGQTHLGPLDVIPPDRDFHRWNPALARDEEILDVEAEA